VGELESHLHKSAKKKGLSEEEEKRYVGGTIQNMRKKGELPKREKKPPAEKKPRKPSQKQVEARSAKVEKEYRAKEKKQQDELIQRIHTGNRPKLTGTEKQVAWAKEIRSAYIHKRRAEVGHPTKLLSPMERQRIEKYDEEFNHQTQWWITHRYGLGLKEYRGHQK